MNRLKHSNRLVYLSLALVMVLGGSVRASDTDSRIESSFRNSSILKTDLKDDLIQVSSQNGVVTLAGEVSSKNHKVLAENIAGEIPGVKRIDNQLKIKNP